MTWRNRGAASPGHAMPVLVTVMDGGRSSVVRASGLKSEDPWFDPLAGKGEGQFVCPFESTVLQACLCLTDPPIRVHGTHPHYCVCTLNIPYPSVVKE